MRRVLFLQDVNKFEWSLNMHSVGFFWWFLLLWVCWNISNRDTTNEDEYQFGKSLFEIRQNWSELIKIYHNMERKEFSLNRSYFENPSNLVILKVCWWSISFFASIKTLVQNIWQFKKMMGFFCEINELHLHVSTFIQITEG